MKPWARHGSAVASERSGFIEDAENDIGPSPVRENGPLGSAEVFKSKRQSPVPKIQNDRGSLVVLFGIRIWVE